MRNIVVDNHQISVSEDGKTFLKSNGEAYTISVNKMRSNRRSLFINGKNYYCNRLVAKAYPEICGEWFEGCEVHHIDEDPTNDNAKNLTIVNPAKHRIIHQDRIIYCGKESAIPTHQYTFDGKYVASFSSSIEAADKLGICGSSIRNALSGLSSSAGGYLWIATKDEPPATINPLKSYKERCRDAFGKPVSQYTLDGKWIRDFGSANEARDFLGKTSGAINNCLKGRARSAYGFIWKYAS